MKIQLEQSEIVNAVREYVANQGIKVEGKTFAVNFSMTRGEAGLLADLVIDEPAAAPTNVKATTKPRANTVGAAIDKQADKASGTANVNKLPATASEAVAQAKEATQTGGGSEEVAANPEASAGGEEVAAETSEEKVKDEPEVQKTTTSLFG